MKTFFTKYILIVILNLLSLSLFLSQQAISQSCTVNAGPDLQFSCSGSVNLNASINDEWLSVTSPTYWSLYAVFFADTSVGYITSGNSKILKTTDGGSNWTTLTTVGINNLYAAYFINKNIGYCAGGYGEILKTTDGGATWIDQTLNSSNINSLYSLYFLNKDTGFAVGVNGTLLKTVNGGNNWITITGFSSDDLFSIHFADSLTGYIVGDQILKTTNGGANWYVSPSSGALTTLYSAYFPSKDTSYAVGLNGTILKTVNSSSSWIPQNSGTTNYFNSVFFLDNNTGFAVGDSGVVLKTENGGATWLPEYTTVPNNYSVISIHLADKDHGCFVGSDGLLYKKFVNKFTWSPSAGLSSSNIPNPVASPLSTTNYIVTVTFPGGCTSTDTVNVSIVPHLPPDICIVLVDSTLGKNKIIWEKPLNVNYIQSYKIYKETSTAGVYTNIGTLPFSQLTEFVDTSSKPIVHSDRYKLSFIDTCGFETNLSNSHKTLHLSVSPNGSGNGFQLIWTDQYEGYTFLTYNIYRRTSYTNFTKIDSIAYGNTSYTDTTSLHGRLYYFVSAVRPTPCSSSGLPKAVGGPYSQSISNIEDNGIANQGIQDINYGFKELKIYPNPFSDKTTIFFDNTDKQGYSLKITDITGNIVREINNIRSNSIELNKDNLPVGFYIIELRGKFLYKGKVIIK